MLTQAELKALVIYDPINGTFTNHSGQPLGWTGENGYIYLRTGDYKTPPRLAHRLAWLYMTGSWPTKQIDHKDTIRSNNAWDNLREATSNQNKWNTGMRKNNTSGVKGVTWDKSANRWKAGLTFKGKYITVGRFDDLNEAAEALSLKRAELHGNYANNG